MKINRRNIIEITLSKIVLGVTVLVGMVSCTSDPNSPGIEFMPDMYRPEPYEAYLEKYDYDSAEFFERNIEKIAPNFEYLKSDEKAEIVNEINAIYATWNQGRSSRKPVSGTIAEGKKPYLFSKEERDLTKGQVSPFSYTKETIKEGKAYYEIFCDHCHGEKGDGNGPMVTLGVYPAQPPSYAAAAKDLTAGEIYHTIYWGKGVMGSHASQISEDKRWKIVMYVQTLQGNKLEDLSGVVVPADSLTVAVVDTVSK